MSWFWKIVLGLFIFLFSIVDLIGQNPDFKFYKKITKVKKNSLYALKSENGELIAPFFYTDILRVKHTKYALLFRDSYFTIFDIDKKVSVSQTIEIADFDNLNEVNGEVCINPDYAIIGKMNEKMGAIGIDGAVKIRFEHDELSLVDSSFYAAKKNGNYAIIRADFSRISTFDIPLILGAWNNYVVCWKYARWIFVGFDATENKTIDTDVITWKSFSKDGKFGVISSDGQEIIPFEYDSVIVCDNSFHIIAKKNNKVGLIDAEKKVILDFRFDKITEDGTGKFLLQDGIKHGFYILGKEIIWN